ncbi:hypothetical protein [Stieleria maiorica]|uniref:hypothetical protein n=1 Tax=Stieleria maiorica TaxID=2795974 RepID=UPI0011C93CAA|nr:hypothetical protein [Stieleria maiorica]
MIGDQGNIADQGETANTSFQTEPKKNADAWMVLELEADAAKSFDGTVKCCEALNHQKYWVE